MLDLKKVVDFDKTYIHQLVSPADGSDLPVKFQLHSRNSKHVQAKLKALMTSQPDLAGEDFGLHIAAYCVSDVDGEIQLPESDKAMNPKKVTDIIAVFRENIWVADQVLEAASHNANFTNG